MTAPLRSRVPLLRTQPARRVPLSVVTREHHGIRRALLLAVASLIVVGIVAGVSVIHVRLTQTAFDLQEEQEMQRELDDRHEMLELAVAELESPERIAARARDELGMVEPAPEDVVLVASSPVPGDQAVVQALAGEDDGTDTTQR